MTTRRRWLIENYRRRFKRQFSLAPSEDSDHYRPMVTPRELAERMKADIVADVTAGTVPAAISAFADLHEHIDPNCLGKAADLFGEMVTESATDHEHQAEIDAFSVIFTPATEIVDAWIKAGGIETALTLQRATAKGTSLKIAVYRPREPNGLGPPQAFLGDEHPTQGDWVQSAKHKMQKGEYRPLLMMGRNFLIYSIYHAREPRFLGYAVENFGAACRKLGYTLPLTENDACWLPYGAEGLDSGTPHDYQHMLGHIAAVFGAEAAKEQAKAIDIQWPAASM